MVGRTFLPRLIRLISLGGRCVFFRARLTIRRQGRIFFVGFRRVAGSLRCLGIRFQDEIATLVPAFRSVGRGIFQRLAVDVQGRQFLVVHQKIQLVAGDGLPIQQGARNAVQDLFIILEELAATAVGFFHDALDLGVHQTGRVFAEVFVLHPFSADKDLFTGLADGQRAHSFAHAPLADHLAGHTGDALNVVGRAGGDVVENQFLGHAAAQQDHQVVFQIAAGITVAVFLGQLHGHAQSAAARDNGDLVHRVGTGQQPGGQGVAAFMVSGDPLLLVREDQAAPLTAHEHLVLGKFKIAHVQLVLVQLGRLQGRLVDQIFQIRAGKARRAARQHFQVHVRIQGRALGVHFKNAAAAAQIRRGHHHLAVETAGPQQGRVQHVRTVGGRDEDDALIAFKTVHFHQQLVQGLLALVMAAAQPGAALAAHGVDFVNKNQAGRIFLALHKEVAHARSAHAHEHFHKVRAGNGKERHPGLTGHGARQQGFTRAGRAYQQNALGNAPAQAGELFGIGEELHHFRKFLLGLIHARHVGKGNARAVLIEHTRLGTAETHGFAAAALHLAHEENPDADEQQHGEPGNQKGHIPGGLFRRLGLDFHLFLNEPVDQARILRGIGLDALVVRGLARERVPLDGHG